MAAKNNKTRQPIHQCNVRSGNNTAQAPGTHAFCPVQSTLDEPGCAHCGAPRSHPRHS